MAKPLIVEGRTPGTVNGCLDANGNFISINADGPAGDWCRSFAAAQGNRVIPPHSGNFFGWLFGKHKHKTNNSNMRNFMSLTTLTQPTTIVPVGIAAVAGGFAGNWASKKVKIPFLSKYPKVHKIVWIAAGALALAIATKMVVDSMQASKAPSTDADNIPEADTTPKSVEVTVQ